jgi:hypothetical protein
MNNKIKLLSVSVGSLLVTSAMADYTGLSYDGIDNGNGTWTAHIYVDFTDETDELNWVGGNAQNNLFITSTDGFYQHGFGGPTSTYINPAFYDMFPSLAYDSWVTIQGGDDINNYVSYINVDWTDFESGGDIMIDTPGVWYNTCPNDEYILAGDDLRVMIGQFTMYNLDSSISGVLNFGSTMPSGGTPYQITGQAFNYSLPSPSAIALLGVAGISATRRRR